MFTVTTFYQICIGFLAAVSVCSECWITPDKEGVVNIPNGTETIPKEAFDMCYALKAVKIPASVQNIGSYSFYLTGLEKVIFEEGSLLEVIGEEAFSYCKELKLVTLPPGLKEIGHGAFAGLGLDEVIFEEGSELETIGKYAFWKSKNLKSINIPPGVVIGMGAFKHTDCPECIYTPGATIVDCRIPAETKGLRGN